MNFKYIVEFIYFTVIVVLVLKTPLKPSPVLSDVVRDAVRAVAIVVWPATMLWYALTFGYRRT